MIRSSDGRFDLPDHSYRCVLTAGAQPAVVENLLKDKRGLPDRFVYVDVVNPDFDENAEYPDPEPLVISVPEEWTLGVEVQIEFPPEVREEVRADFGKRQRGEMKDDPQGGRRLINTEKIAVALALIEGRGVVNSEDWALAKRVMVHSDQVRAGLLLNYKKLRDWADKAAGKSKAIQEEAKEEHRHEIKMQKAVDFVLRKLKAHPGQEFTWSLVKPPHRTTEHLETEDIIDKLRDTEGCVVSEKTGTGGRGGKSWVLKWQ